MKRYFKNAIVTLGLLAILAPMGAQTAFAQFTILPQVGEQEAADCTNIVAQYESGNTDIKTLGDVGRRNLLGCAVQTGRISLNMIPYFVSYFANFLLSLVGLVSMLFIVIGGYFYIWGGLTDNKEKGKKTVYHALLGMAVAILAWAFVNVVISAITS